METRLIVRGVPREPNDNLKRVIDNCKKHIFLDHLDLYSDVVVTPLGEYLYFNASINEGKPSTLDICFSDDSEWLTPNEEPDN